MAEITHIETLTGLITLDLAYNKLTKISGLDHQSGLTDLWVNANSISGMESMEYLVKLPALDVIYIGDNPVTKEAGYIEQIKANCPKIKQIDA